MADVWVDASTALELCGDHFAICERCEAGLIRSRARLFKRDKSELIEADVPREFWWAAGHEALEQNWEHGAFSTWIDSSYHWRAFGVRFALEDLLRLLPIEQHATIRRRLSVAGNPAWVSALQARRFAYDTAGLNPMSAGAAVVEQCRLGFIAGRAVEMLWAQGSKSDNRTTEAREWDIPIWFWKDFTLQGSSSQNWEQGLFAGNGRAPQGRGSMTLNGVHFLRSSLDVLLPVAAPLADGQELIDPKKPALSERDLQRWWEKLAGARDALTQEQLRALAVNDHPQNTVSRDRIRGLAEGRKPGPKSIRP